MARLAAKIIFAASLLAVAACSKKPPAELPPAPVTEQPDQGVDQGVGNEIVPGSQADFVSKVMSDRVLFALDDHALDAEDRQILDSQIAWVKQYPNVRATIEGHADERGTREYNLALGERRANAAKNYLAANGIASTRISTISYGKERPDALGSDETSWARNRRAVTVTVQ